MEQRLDLRVVIHLTIDILQTSMINNSVPSQVAKDRSIPKNSTHLQPKIVHERYG